MPSSIFQIVLAKKKLRDVLARRATRKYTHIWNRVIKEAEGHAPKSRKYPPSFLGTLNQKFNRGAVFKNRILNFAYRHPRIYQEGYLYRGIKKPESNVFKKTKRNVRRPTLTSFTKSAKIAKNVFAKNNGIVLRWNVRNRLIPSINFTTGRFQSEYMPGGYMYNGNNEQEVLLPPGKFHIKSKSKNFYNVNFIPNNKKNTSYLHTQPQRARTARLMRSAFKTKTK
jgi:hypothetical protein